MPALVSARFNPDMKAANRAWSQEPLDQ